MPKITREEKRPKSTTARRPKSTTVVKVKKGTSLIFDGDVDNEGNPLEIVTYNTAWKRVPVDVCENTTTIWNDEKHQGLRKKETITRGSLGNRRRTGIKVIEGTGVPYDPENKEHQNLESEIITKTEYNLRNELESGTNTSKDNSKRIRQKRIRKTIPENKEMFIVVKGTITEFDESNPKHQAQGKEEINRRELRRRRKHEKVTVLIGTSKVVNPTDPDNVGKTEEISWALKKKREYEEKRSAQVKEKKEQKRKAQAERLAEARRTADAERLAQRKRKFEDEGDLGQVVPILNSSGSGNTTTTTTRSTPNTTTTTTRSTATNRQVPNTTTTNTDITNQEGSRGSKRKRELSDSELFRKLSESNMGFFHNFVPTGKRKSGVDYGLGVLGADLLDPSVKLDEKHIFKKPKSS